jgi:hypothetical protein
MFSRLDDLPENSSDNVRYVLGILTYVRNVMTGSQIPFSCYPPCATLFGERRSFLFRMNKVGAGPRFSISPPL